jgi:hypothetical protein
MAASTPLRSASGAGVPLHSVPGIGIPLRELFVYPIERYIPPVAKVNDLAEAVVEADLREYVVTAPIEGALMAFLEGYAESRTATTDRIGVWISGFFGAGKSHFAKMLGYLLENRAVGGQTARELFAARLAGSSHRTEIEGLLHRAGLLDSRVITFQIKAEQDLTNKDDSISEIMYRSYLVRRGLSKSLTVAGLELSLIERGLYDAFRAEVERRTGRPWAEEREDFLFIRSTVAEALQTVAPNAYRSRDEALAALDLTQRSQGLSVSDLAARLTDHVNGDHYTGGHSLPAAIAGYPSITVPAGYVRGLPVGITFVGTAWTEPRLIRYAYAFEQATKMRRPPEFLRTVNG